MNDKGLIAWAKNGIREALTIEEIRKVIPVQSVTCYILVGITDSYESRTEEWRYCNTTEELENWLDTAYARAEELKPVSRYAVICLALYGRNPLCIEACASAISETSFCASALAETEARAAGKLLPSSPPSHAA